LQNRLPQFNSGRGLHKINDVGFVERKLSDAKSCAKRPSGNPHPTAQPSPAATSAFQNPCMVAQPNETPSLFSVRQITRHGRLERARSKERANEVGIPTEDGKCTHAPTFVRLRTVQSKTDERLFKMILAPFNARVR